MANHGYGICPSCKAIVAALIPKGGDGSSYVPYYHKITPGNNVGTMIPCPGRFMNLWPTYFTKRAAAEARDRNET